MIANLVAHLTRFMVWQRGQYSSTYGFPKFVVLLIDSVLIVSAKYLSLMYTMYTNASNNAPSYTLASSYDV